MKAYIRFVLRRQWWVLSTVLLISIAAGWMLTHAVVASSVAGLFLGEQPAYASYVERVQDFGSDDLLIITFAESSPLSTESQKKLTLVIEELKSGKSVESVYSLLDVQKIESSEEGIAINTYGDLALDNPAEIPHLLEALKNEPWARGFFISADGTQSAVVLELVEGSTRPAEETPQIIEGVFKAFELGGYEPDELHLIGLSANVAAVMEETFFNITRLFPLVVLVLFIAVWMMFRRFWPVFITSAVTFIASLWTMGFAVLLDRQVNIFTGIVPAVILIIAFSDVVHLVSAYLLELEKGHSKEEAILNSGSEVGAACVFTSMTTFVGFISLSTVPTPVTRLLGVVLGFGAAIALLIAVTITPILLHLFGPSKTWRVGKVGQLQDLLDKGLRSVTRLTTEWPKAIILAFAVLLVFSLVGVMQGTIETDFTKRMSSDHRLRTDLEHFREHFVSANGLDIYISTPEPEGLINAEIFSQIALYQDALRKDPQIGEVYSLVDVMESLYGALTFGEEKGRLPDTQSGLAQCLLLFEASGGSDLERLVDYDRQRMRLRLRLNDQEFRRTAIIGAKAKELSKEFFGDEVDVEISGLTYILGFGFDDILDAQKRALLIVFLVIALMMMIGLRSVGVGLWSMVPNLLPLFVLGGFAGFFWEYIDSDILIIAIIAIGVGVDDTIHFLMRFRIEALRHENISEVISQTFFYAGRGIIMTSIILILGFAPFAFSDYFSIWVFGTMLPLTLFVALIADLFFLPALAQLGLIRFQRPPGHGTNANEIKA